MRLYLWRYVDYISGSYHHEGGVVAVAASLERARELIKAKRERRQEKDCGALTVDPDLVYSIEDSAPETVEIFPNAGCC